MIQAISEKNVRIHWLPTASGFNTGGEAADDHRAGNEEPLRAYAQHEVSACVPFVHSNFDIYIIAAVWYFR